MPTENINLPDMSRLSASGIDFIDESYFESLLSKDKKPDSGRIDEIISKSKSKVPLTIEETAVLLATEEPEIIERIFETARLLKRDIYGNRIVIFAPLYVGNYCMNDCVYCGFRRSNKESIRRTLTAKELREQVTNLLRMGHKRTIAVFGEHINYGPVFIANCVNEIYSVKNGLDSIRRVNINAAPLSHEGYRIVKSVGIGTYQVFQETYHHSTYARMHPAGTRKSNFAWRLDAPARAIESGCDDVGLGALMGLANWKFEILSLVAHANHLMKNYGVGPHTISFPRIRPASGVTLKEIIQNDVSDSNFLRLIAILRLSVPYTGLIVTAREPAEIRKTALGFGVSQIDAGGHIEIGGYVNNEEEGTKDIQVQALEKEQFELGDVRQLDEVILQLLKDGYIPSFCTACYRLGRTGKVFMEYAIPGFIQNMCTPNALMTLKEYLVDHASQETRFLGEKMLQDELNKIPDSPQKSEIAKRIDRINNSTDRDLYF
ncbi:MAG: [FeFe] hydrogenase H-cluster radical SAM maturase HydG [Planctomycetaceae bacterium]|jgi:2-iminoacetate synthase|nr:[FeFe] hydrogenase H-cluster radical SAM maturase HydG [Planctomycetaceae bacterium]